MNFKKINTLQGILEYINKVNSHSEALNEKNECLAGDLLKDKELSNILHHTHYSHKNISNSFKFIKSRVLKDLEEINKKGEHCLYSKINKYIKNDLDDFEKDYLKLKRYSSLLAKCHEIAAAYDLGVIKGNIDNFNKINEEFHQKKELIERAIKSNDYKNASEAFVRLYVPAINDHYYKNINYEFIINNIKEMKKWVSKINSSDLLKKNILNAQLDFNGEELANKRKNMLELNKLIEHNLTTLIAQDSKAEINKSDKNRSTLYQLQNINSEIKDLYEKRLKIQTEIKNMHDENKNNQEL